MAPEAARLVLCICSAPEGPGLGGSSERVFVDFKDAQFQSYVQERAECSVRALGSF